MTSLPYRRWSDDDYDPAANSRECYNDAIAAIRLRMVRDGDLMPREDEPVEIMTLWAMR